MRRPPVQIHWAADWQWFLVRVRFIDALSLIKARRTRSNQRDLVKPAAFSALAITVPMSIFPTPNSLSPSDAVGIGFRLVAGNAEGWFSGNATRIPPPAKAEVPRDMIGR